MIQYLSLLFFFVVVVVVVACCSCCSLTHMLILAHHHNAIGHRHVDFVVVAPVVRAAAVAQRHVVHVVVELAGRLDALRHAHLFANVLHVVALLEHWVLLEAVGERRTGHGRELWFSLWVCCVVVVVGRPQWKLQTRL